MVMRIVDPADGKLVGEVSTAEAAEVEAAIGAARNAAPGWERTAPAERAAALSRAADRIELDAADLALLTTREMGKPLDDSRGGVAAGVSTLRQYAELGPLHRGKALQGSWSATDLMVPGPVGVVAVITPWNDPVAVSCGLLGAALVTGNTVIYKPSERTPHTGQRLAEYFAGLLPDGVLTLLSGDGEVGALLSRSPGIDLIAHVGSTATGRSIAAAAATTGAKVVLENGGNDPLIVDSDVNPEWAASQAALGAFANAGQICTSVERIYVTEAVAPAFLPALVDRAGRITAGACTDPPLALGPLVDDRQRSAVHEQVTAAVAAGAQLLTGGEVPPGPGSHYPATVLSGCRADMTIMQEETFGPVAPVQVVPSFEIAMQEACTGRYGLAATVLTGSMEHAQRAWRTLPVGTVKINAVFGGAPGGAAHPRRASGRGFGYGPELLDEMTVTKVVHIAPPPEA